MYQPWPGTAISHPTSKHTYSSLHPLGNKHWQIEYIRECTGESSFGFSLSFSPSLLPLTGFSSARRCHTNLTRTLDSHHCCHPLTHVLTVTHTAAHSCSSHVSFVQTPWLSASASTLSSSSQVGLQLSWSLKQPTNPRLTCEPPHSSVVLGSSFGGIFNDTLTRRSQRSVSRVEAER